MMPKPKTDPEILTLPDQKMAALTVQGDPNEVLGEVLPALYGSVYTLKFQRKKAGTGDFKVGALRARWPDAHLLPKDQWTGHLGLPVPEDVTELPQKVAGVTVRLETWTYGTVGQILHLGPYAAETPTIQRLHEFIAAAGYELAGPHEEEYLTKPEAENPKTVIRYQVRKK